MKKAFETVVMFVNAILSLLGLSFLAGTVAGAIIEGEGKKVKFSVGGSDVIDDNAEETTSAEEITEETDED